MTLQIIKSIKGKEEYVLLPIKVYQLLHEEIDSILDNEPLEGDEYVTFELSEYVKNPIALARIRAHLTQGQLAKRLKVSQAYISKIEKQARISAKLLAKVNHALNHQEKKQR